MRYEVYGILSRSGANTFIGARQSISRALKLVRSHVASTVYPRFAILEKPSKHSYPYAINTGATDEGMIRTSNMLVYPAGTVQSVMTANPLSDEGAGAAFWAKRWGRD